MIATLVTLLVLAADPAPAAVPPAKRPAAVKAVPKAPAATPAPTSTSTPAPASTPTSTPTQTPPPAAAAKAPPRKPGPAKLAVMDVVLTGRDTSGLDGAALTELLAASLEDAELYRMTTSRDLSAMLGLEKVKQMAGCTEDTSCLAEIAGSMGVDYLVSAGVGSLEGRLVISARLVDVRRGAVVGRSSETVSARGEAGDAIQRAGRRLRNGARAARGLAPVTEAEPAPRRALAWGGFLGAAFAPSEKTAGGEALVTLGAGSFEGGAGVTIAAKPALRLQASWALSGGPLSLRLGVKALAGPASGGAVLGGGPAAWLRWRLSPWLDADLVGSAEYLKGPSESKLVPVVALGLHAHAATPPAP